MRRALPLLAALLLLVPLLAAPPARGQGQSRLFLPQLGSAPPPPIALAPDQLGTPLDVATKPSAFFADQVAEPGGNLAIWLPPGRPVLRGVLFLNGTANAPNPADPDWRNEVAQDRLLAARQLASLWNFALVTGGVWDIDRPAAYLDGALRHWAAALGRPELANAPLAIDGGSRFSNFCRSEAAEHFRGRVIACTIIVGGARATSEANIGIPSLVAVGERDRGAEIISGSVLPARRSGSLISGVLIWGKGHVCDRCQDLTWPFLDLVIAARLPRDADPRGGPVALRAMDEGRGQLGNLLTWAGPWAYEQAPLAPRELGWLPDRASAMLWAAFVLNNPPLRITSPTSPYSWSNGFSQDPSSARAGQPFTLEASVSAPAAGPLIFYDRDRPLGGGTLSADGKRLTLANVRLEPGMHNLFVMGPGGPVSWPAGLIVLP